MLLENNYYQILTETVTPDRQEGRFSLRLLPDCNVYRGHFPGRPVCPGVCHIETIKECAMRLTGKRLSIGFIKKCRFPALATPSACPEIVVTVSACPAETGYSVTAQINDSEKTYATFKGIMMTV